jgi:hypothetical protein
MGKHRDKMEQDLALRGFSSKTCEGYVRYARAFVQHFGRSADELGTEQVRSWVHASRSTLGSCVARIWMRLLTSCTSASSNATSGAMPSPRRTPT